MESETRIWNLLPFFAFVAVVASEMSQKYHFFSADHFKSYGTLAGLCAGTSHGLCFHISSCQAVGQFMLDGSDIALSCLRHSDKQGLYLVGI